MIRKKKKNHYFQKGTSKINMENRRKMIQASWEKKKVKPPVNKARFF
jgi:hypothetical protein